MSGINAPSWKMLKRMHLSTTSSSSSSSMALRRRVAHVSIRMESSYRHLQNQNRNQKTISAAKRWCSDPSVGFHFRSFSTNLNANSNANSTANANANANATEKSVSTKGKGEDIYQQALQLMKQAKDVDNEREQERSNMMYKAWQKSKEKDLNPKSQGVTVVKTLVKETRKDRTKNDDGSDKRIEANELLKQATNEYNHPEAAIQLGNMLLKDTSRSININNKTNNNNTNRNNQQDGLDPKVSVAQAMELFRRAGDAGSRVGWYNLGHLLWTGFPPQKDVEDESEEEDSNTAVGDEIEDTQIVVADIEEAMKAFTKAINLGDSDAMYLVGVHRIGQDDLESYRDGIKLIERAADTGHGGALYYLALLYLNGDPQIGLGPCSLEEFVNRLDRAVEAGNVDAKFVRGNSFYHGTEGYPQDFKKALHDFLQASDEGHADSAVSAGAMLHNGVGVLNDHRRAFELYQLGGELGSEEGWMNVVDCWRQGLGVPKSKETARYIEETMLKKKK